MFGRQSTNREFNREQSRVTLYTDVSDSFHFRRLSEASSGLKGLIRDFT